MLKALLFDVDGVLAETEDFHRLAYNALFRELGIPIEWGKADYVGQLHQVGGMKVQELEREGRIPKGAAARVYGRKREIYLRLLGEAEARGALPPRPGVGRLAEEARKAGLLLAAASTSAPEAVRAVMRAVFGGRAGCLFAEVLSGDDVQALKPDPAVYRLACGRIGVMPSEAIAIEDTRHGLASALGAGLACLVTPSEFTRGQEFPGASAVLEDLDHGPEGPVTVADLARWRARRVPDCI